MRAGTNARGTWSHPDTKFAEEENEADAMLEKAASIGFDRYLISATTPFTREDLVGLRTNASQVLKRISPDYEDEYARRSWRMFPDISRVYVKRTSAEEP